MSTQKAFQVEVMLELRRLGLCYGGQVSGERKWILRNLDLTVRPGEFVTIMGSSGAGKSTLLSVVAQALAPSDGEILFRGQRVGGSGIPPNPGCNRQIGYVTQDDNLLPWRTVWENVLFPLSLAGPVSDADVQRAKRLLAQVGLADWHHHYPHQLSGGMRKRAALARTLVYDPPVVLMDEPFGALDAETRAQLQSDLLRLWCAQKKTILFVTHDINEAIALGDRVVVLSGSPGQVALERQIEIERPRDPELIFKAPGFAAHHDAIRACLRGTRA
jgi:NitT/TauT family transport system ATP-binding protein